MVSFVKPEDSAKELELIAAIEEEIFQDLKLPYRKLLICTGDLGVPAAKKYDLEARFPGMNTFKEVTSCSNCTDFQARRARIKYKDQTNKGLVHTLNGTALALGRTLACIVENYQTADGNIRIPDVLQQYMGGQTIINLNA
jgi:seryl-tRNA synthetase